jgi:hypothetical protein
MIDHLPRADENPGPDEAPWWLEDAFYGTDEAEEAGPWTGVGKSMAAGFLALLRDEGVAVIVVERRDRFARFGADYVEAALAASGRRLLVVHPSGVDDDLAAAGIRPARPAQAAAR